MPVRAVVWLVPPLVVVVFAVVAAGGHEQHAGGAGVHDLLVDRVVWVSGSVAGKGVEPATGVRDHVHPFADHPVDRGVEVDLFAVVGEVQLGAGGHVVNDLGAPGAVVVGADRVGAAGPQRDLSRQLAAEQGLVPVETPAVEDPDLDPVAGDSMAGSTSAWWAATPSETTSFRLRYGVRSRSTAGSSASCGSRSMARVANTRSP